MTLEEEIVAKGLIAPRITPADIETNLKSEYYFTAEQAVAATVHQQDELTRLAGWDGELKLLTFCVLVTKNGFTVTGESACASPKNFYAELGRKIARDNAIEKLWPLMGYELKTKLHEEEAKNALVAALGEDDCEGCKI